MHGSAAVYPQSLRRVPKPAESADGNVTFAVDFVDHWAGVPPGMLDLAFCPGRHEVRKGGGRGRDVLVTQLAADAFRLDAVHTGLLFPTKGFKESI